MKMNGVSGWMSIPERTTGQVKTAPAPFGRYIENINGVVLELARAPHGTFIMGNDLSPYPEEKPAHLVRMSSFFMGRYEVTREQWNIVVDTLPQVNRSLTRQYIGPLGSGFILEKTSPADAMFWADAVEFCDRLTRFTGKKYRLPTEAEWEYACRAGTTTEYSYGDEIDYSLAHVRNFEAGDPSFSLIPVGGKGYANAWGFYDMHGNVSEYCLDRKHANYLGAPTDGSEWSQGGDNSARVQRGGAYPDRIEFSRSSARIFYSTALRASGFGFRVVAEINMLPVGQISAASAADYAQDGLAVESIATLFGTDLSVETEIAASLPLPVSLSGASVSLQDMDGIEHLAPLFFSSPNQINFQIPPGVALGTALIRVTRSDGNLATGSIEIKQMNPGLFAADASGAGLAAALALRVRANGEQVYESVVRFDPVLNRFVGVPVDLNNPTDEVFLILFGTGFRRHSTNVIAEIGGGSAEVIFAGAHGNLVGLDQCNLRLSGQLAGQGEVDVRLTVDGETSNTVRVVIK